MTKQARLTKLEATIKSLAAHIEKHGANPKCQSGMINNFAPQSTDVTFSRR